MTLHTLPFASAQQRGKRGLTIEWTSERLQELVSSAQGAHVMVVSCREPYSHERTVDGVQVSCPASGMVTALEPVVRACGGTWIAHASGSADAEFVDAKGVCPVPPEHPTYSLRRVWLEEQERRCFLDGFANEGLWPMCHLSDVAPVFRESDWMHYQQVNEKFAEAVVQAATQPDPLVLVQDYHFALLPQLLRVRLPHATVVAFWHIPWPSRDLLERCPWWQSLVRGLRDSSIIGFQTARDRVHFNEAVELCQRRSTLGLQTAHNSRSPRVASYPISVLWPTATEMNQLPSTVDCRRRVLQGNGLAPRVRLIVGVDRFDYTKGLLEKVLAVECLLDKYPHWRGAVSLIQVAAPTRKEVPAYAAYQVLVCAEVERINRRLCRNGVIPIVLLKTHHNREAVCMLYRAACVCAVTSLQDGMNLVSKEFVSMRDDEQGVLVLSAFAGAAEALQPDAIVVDPRNIAALADSLAQALAMEAAQQRQRMVRMRHTVRNANVYQWAGRMLSDALELRGQGEEEAVAAWPEVA